MNSVCSQMNPRQSGPAYTKGLYVYPGDVIRRHEPNECTVIVRRITEGGTAIEVYDPARGEIFELSTEVVWASISRERAWETFWQCIGREALTVLDDAMYRTFIMQAHLVFIKDHTAESGLMPTVCFSRCETNRDQALNPMEMTWSKYRSSASLVRDLKNPYDNDRLSKIQDWLSVAPVVRETLGEFTHTVIGMSEIRATDMEYLLSHPSIVN